MIARNLGIHRMDYIKIVRSVKQGVPTSFDPTLKPENDMERARAMRRFRIFDTPSEEIFSLYTQLAAVTLKAPIGLMSFVDEEMVHYKESYGLNRAGEIVNRRNSPCSLAIMTQDVSQFRYALADPCILADEKVLAEAGYKFYAGAPLIANDGYAIGIFAVVDKAPRVFTSEELSLLRTLATEVMSEIEFRLQQLDKPNPIELNTRILQVRHRVERGFSK